MASSLLERGPMDRYYPPFDMQNPAFHLIQQHGYLERQGFAERRIDEFAVQAVNEKIEELYERGQLEKTARERLVREWTSCLSQNRVSWLTLSDGVIQKVKGCMKAHIARRLLAAPEKSCCFFTVYNYVFTSGPLFPIKDVALWFN